MCRGYVGLNTKWYNHMIPRLGRMKELVIANRKVLPCICL